MDFELSEELSLLQKTVRDFARVEVAPFAAENDRKGTFPAEILKKASELGFLGILIPEEYGGVGLGSLAVSILIEDDAGALSYVDFDLPASATAGLQVTSDVLIQPGPPTVAQQAFQADWSTKASLYSDPDAKAKAYRAAKAKALGGSKKMEVTP